MTKLLLIVGLFALSCSCTKTPIKFVASDFSEGRNKYSLLIKSDKIPKFGTFATVSINSMKIFSRPLAQTYRDTIKVELFELEESLQRQIANLLLDNEKITLTVNIFDRNQQELGSFPYQITNPVNRALKYLEYDYNDHFVYNWDNLERNDIIETVRLMIDNYVIDLPFNRDVPIFPKKDEVRITLKYHPQMKFDIYFNSFFFQKDVMPVRKKITESQSMINAECIVLISETFNGTIYCNLRNGTFGSLYTFPILTIDRTPPKFISSYIDNKTDSYSFFSETDAVAPNGTVKISHGTWRSEGYYSPITFEVYVSGDVDRIFFDNKAIKFVKGKTKYTTLNLVTHVGKNVFEVVAIDRFGNKSTEDYIFSAQSIKD